MDLVGTDFQIKVWKEIKKILGQEGSGFSRLKSLLKLMRITKPIQQQNDLGSRKSGQRL